ncbi:MAG: thymidylate synthase [Patescibacteria group bacterium]|nr:thymidylate synthase [Patescibacteria group bacterium]
MLFVTPEEAVVGLDLPHVQVVADNLPQGWEESVVACWGMGTEIQTQYDKPTDPNSRDIALSLSVRDPFAEPRIHRALPGGMYDLESYVQEVVDGIHDHWIDPEAGKWQYTYHERMATYSVPGLEKPVDQLAQVVKDLVAAPYTRRAQISIWKPWEDAGFEHPACLQNFWFRVFNDRLVMRCHIRSNDAFKAAFMNMFAFTELQKVIAERVSIGLGRPIAVGQYDHIADSFHIYGSYFEDFVQGFLVSLEARSFEQRTYRTEQVAPLFKEAREKIAAKPAQKE